MALGALLVTGGDYRRAVLAAVNYGRDADSIATMVGSLCGALHGIEVVPSEWIDGVSEGSRMDITRDRAGHRLGRARCLGSRRGARLRACARHASRSRSASRSPRC